MSKGKPLLQIDKLNVSYPGPLGRMQAVRDANMHISRGEIAGLAGESGSGKSTIMFAILRYLGAGSIDAGCIMIDNIDITKANLASLQALRAKRIALVPQDPLAALNPVMTIADQLIERPIYTQGSSRGAALQVAQGMLLKVKLDQPQRILRSYPHQLSGGQQQRVLIASALMASPDVLLLDEPTTGLDPAVQNSIMDLIKALVDEYQMACLFVSHDLDLLGRVCDSLTIMQNGSIVESGSCADIITNPQMAYTKALMAARPGSACRAAELPDGTSQTLLQVSGLTKTYGTQTRWFNWRPDQPGAPAISNINAVLSKGETLAIVGESGSGKSTFAKLLLGLEISDSGSIIMNGKDIARQTLSQRDHNVLHTIQMVFQNPASTLNPTHKTGYQLSRALVCAPSGNNSNRYFSTVEDLLTAVRLPLDIAAKYPGDLSGGQKQRIAIARALAVNPKILVADEPVSALDVSVQASIIALLLELQKKLALAMIFISHDLPLVRSMADRVAVMHKGAIVETGTVQSVFTDPQHPITRALLDAARLDNTNQAA